MSNRRTNHDDLENGAFGSLISGADFKNVRSVVGLVTRVEAFSQAGKPA